MIVTTSFRAGLAALAFAAFGAPAAAAPDALGEFGSWAAWALSDSGGKLCYMYAEPTKEEGDYTSRGDTYMQITHRAAAGTRNVVSVTAGYTYKTGSEVEIAIDDAKKFKLFTDSDTAWAQDAETDAAIVEAMRGGQRMVVRGTSSRGTLTTDTYSLIGVTAANGAIGKACAAK